MPENRTKTTSLSKSKNIQELSAFWDTHDLADYEEETYEVEFEVNLETRKRYVALEPELLSKIRKFARLKGINIESLVNLWLQQKIDTVNHKNT